MVNVRIPPGANCLLATKLQTDSTGCPLESVIHIGYDALTITTIHPKDSLLWEVFSYRGFFVMFHSLYAAVSLGFLSYLPSSMGKHIKVCPLGKARTEEVPSTPCILSLSLSSRNTLHTDQVALTIHLKLHPTIVNAQVLCRVKAPK